MSHIRHIRRLADALAGLAGAVLAFAAAAPAWMVRYAWRTPPSEVGGG